MDSVSKLVDAIKFCPKTFDFQCALQWLLRSRNENLDLDNIPITLEKYFKEYVEFQLSEHWILGKYLSFSNFIH